jgi:hypothetical protein
MTTMMTTVTVTTGHRFCVLPSPFHQSLPDMIALRLQHIFIDPKL